MALAVAIGSVAVFKPVREVVEWPNQALETVMEVSADGMASAFDAMADEFEPLPVSH